MIKGVIKLTASCDGKIDKSPKNDSYQTMIWTVHILRSEERFPKAAIYEQQKPQLNSMYMIVT